MIKKGVYCLSHKIENAEMRWLKKVDGEERRYKEMTTSLYEWKKSDR